MGKCPNNKLQQPVRLGRGKDPSGKAQPDRGGSMVVLQIKSHSNNNPIFPDKSEFIALISFLTGHK
jgi:hypothetical protein